MSIRHVVRLSVLGLRRGVGFGRATGWAGCAFAAVALSAALLTPRTGDPAYESERRQLTPTRTAFVAASAEISAADRPDTPPLVVPQGDLPGLAVTFTPAADGKVDPAVADVTDTRTSRLAALYVPTGQPASPFLAPGPFVATFDGFLNLRLRDTYTFSAEGRGAVVVTVNDKEVLKAAGDLTKAEAGTAVRLNKGKNKVSIRYVSPSAGVADGKPAGDGKLVADAAFRLLWTVKGEAYADPLPPTVLTHDAGVEAVAKGLRLREGRQLVADLRCVACHQLPALAVAQAKAGAGPSMPELKADTPDLTDVGARLNVSWLTTWVNHPRGLRPTAHMPRMFASAGNDATTIDPRSADVAAYLATLGGADAKAVAPATANDNAIARGGQLFSILNCIACHRQPGAQDDAAAPPPPEGDAAAGDDKPAERVPLKFVKAKFKPGALATFLLNPSAHYQWISMPNFRLSKEEADALAAWLLAEANGELPADLPAGDASKGKQLVESVGCLNCHPVGKDAQPATKFVALNDLPKEGWTRGCLAADDAGRKLAPAYALTSAQREAIVALAATDRSSLLRDTPTEFAERQIKALNCNGCHARDAKESLLSTAYDAELKELEQRYPAPKGEHAESFSPDQRAPLMTWFGEKLRPRWAESFVAGQVAFKPRPYLHARMPAFAARARGLALGMAAEHGCPPTDAAAVEAPNPEMAAVGSKLSGKTPNQAFGCIQCHAVAKQPPLAPFEAPAVNFAHARDRLQKDYYLRWTRNPLKLDPNTKMPAFERDDGKTTITTAYDGDARKQFEAIWQYLLAGDKIKPPAE